jgi:hypothetical protein
MAEDQDPHGWGERTPANLQRLLGRMETKIDGLDRGFADLRRDVRDRGDEFVRQIERRLEVIERDKAEAADVEMLKRIVYGAVAVILLAFIGGLAVVRFTGPSLIPPGAGSHP